jgi:hypothetical protein
MENNDENLDLINQDIDRLSLSDQEIQNYHEHHIKNDVEDIEEEEEEEELTDLIVTSLPNELFSNDMLKIEFENMFKKYTQIEADGDGFEKSVKFFYFRILKRCTVKYSNESAALNARYELDNQIFLGQPIRLFFAQVCFLKY